ncbi:Uncharacterised protein [Mycobacteroides abscessus subsp. massiliense]|nr:Uncharacterised protein [Mycobacteroides abscessus subsp. massiliense]SKU76123.1 Uncharacterised protein [Mycobacteroides abscessus subsp. massiliense]
MASWGNSHGPYWDPGPLRPVAESLAQLLEAMGVDDDDLPEIVPDPPVFNSDDEAAAWVSKHFPKVAEKLAGLS